MNPRLDALLRSTVSAVQANALTPLYALPTAVRRRLAGAPIQIDGNTLDPEIQLLVRVDGLLPGTTKSEAAAARSSFRSVNKLIAGHPRELQRVTDLTVRGADGQLGARLYVPRNAGRGLLVFLHGGGWVVGDLDTHDSLCRIIADDAGIRVLSVDYRLAPEAPAPTAAEDAIAAFTWAVEHAEDLGVDPALVAVGGDSAGGNLAAVVAQQSVARDFARPALQVLLYPAVDLVGRRPSRDLFGENLILTEEDILWYRELYTPDPLLRPDPVVSPLLAKDLTGLPPTLITTAGFDPLRDEGVEYAEALKSAGVDVTHLAHNTLPHGHYNLVTIPGATAAALTALTTHLRTALH
ncbi:alpha/beta hydrolase [Kribbella sp. NPDC058245]|uniref:alpha/beta hydrolase n=1 Tax=Kribbella sp. NPDC058245 TaxID=3346399 RepID=UPI0036E0D76F